MDNAHKVLKPAGTHPKDHEETAAQLLANYFQCNVYFLKTSNIHRADVRIGNIDWEIKSPTGSGKHNIQHQFQRAMKQSHNVVFDARRSKIRMDKIERDVKSQFEQTRTLHKLILIKKTGKILEFSK